MWHNRSQDRDITGPFLDLAVLLGKMYWLYNSKDGWMEESMLQYGHVRPTPLTSRVAEDN